MTVLTPGEYWANPTGYGKCAWCFAKGDLPKSWFVSRLGTVEGKDIPDLEVDTESSATSGSETDDSVDTQFAFDHLSALSHGQAPLGPGMVLGEGQGPRPHTSACLHPTEMAGVPGRPPDWANPTA